jgi:multiple sugar transport system substrate-binding protein
VSFRHAFDRRTFLRNAGLALPGSLAASSIAGPTSRSAQVLPPTVRIQVPDIALKPTVRAIRDQFLSETGITATIRITPAENSLFAIREDIRTGSNALDGALMPMWHIGDLLADSQIVSLDGFHGSGDGRFPEIQLDDEFPAVRTLRRFGDDLVATPFDSDCLLLYYRSDLISDAVHQQAFEQVAGTPLSIPATWDELLRIGEYFQTAGIDTVSLHLRDGGQGMFQYLAVAGPHVIGEENPRAFWFEPESFEPLIASDGHFEALEVFRRLFELGSSEQLSWTLADAWQHFLDGGAVFAIAPADLLTLAIDLSVPLRGKIGVAQLPGTNSYVDPLTSMRHETATPNRAGNVLGPSWGGVIRTSSSMPEAAYHFLALLSGTERQRAFGWGVDDGVDPGRLSQMPPEVDPEGQTPLDDYLDAGFSQSQAIDYTSSILQTLSNPVQLPYLRIPGAFEYLAALDLRLSEFLADGNASPAATLERASDDFRSISQRLGVQRQLELYRLSRV